MKISEYKELYMQRTETVKSVDDYDEEGNIIGKHDETVVIEKPVMGLVVRDATPEQEAEQARAQAEAEAFEANREPTTEEKVEKLMAMQDKTVSISRFEFDLLEMTYADTTYRITEDDGTITTVKGEY